MIIVNAGKSKSSLIIIIAIVVPIAGSVVLFSIGCFFLRRRIKKTHNTSLAENGKQKRIAVVDHHM
jgi:membrane protein DedA with SNARE-associated domain